MNRMKKLFVLIFFVVLVSCEIKIKNPFDYFREETVVEESFEEAVKKYPDGVEVDEYKINVVDIPKGKWLEVKDGPIYMIYPEEWRPVENENFNFLTYTTTQNNNNIFGLAFRNTKNNLNEEIKELNDQFKENKIIVKKMYIEEYIHETSSFIVINTEVKDYGIDYYMNFYLFKNKDRMYRFIFKNKLNEDYEINKLRFEGVVDNFKLGDEYLSPRSNREKLIKIKYIDYDKL